MKTIITNDFSLAMLPHCNLSAHFKPLPPDQVTEYFEPGYGYSVRPANWESAVDDTDMAAIFSEQLNIEIPVRCITVRITNKIRLIVGQITPQDDVRWWLVTFTFHRS